MKDINSCDQTRRRAVRRELGRDDPVWLLQPDDSRILYLSFLLSFFLHVLLYTFLAATRIFHPFAGPPTDIDLLWFSASARDAIRPVHGAEPGTVKHIPIPSDGDTRVSKGEQTPASGGAVPHHVSPAAAASAGAPRKTAIARTVPTTAGRRENGDDSGMVITRFDGKVVEIVEANTEIPVFRTFSAGFRSERQQARIQYFPEEEGRIAKPAATGVTPPPAPETETAAPPPEMIETKREFRVMTPGAAPTKDAVDANLAKASAYQPQTSVRVSLKGSPAGAVDRKKAKAEVSGTRTLPTPTAHTAVAQAQERPVASAAPSPPTAASRPGLPSSAGIRSTPTAPPLPSSPQLPSAPSRQELPRPPAPTSQPTVISMQTTSPSPAKSSTTRPISPVYPKTLRRITKTAPQSEPAIPEAPPSPAASAQAAPSSKKPSATADGKPLQIFLPPLFGDLKLVITGEDDISVEVRFREFPTARRGKPSTKREAQNLKSMVPKVVRTGENVREAVIELTEEGVYYLAVRPSTGSQGTAMFILKIRETGTGGKSVNLGKRTLTGTSVIARVLMPEGILWDDDGYFTGDIEDSESTTKFHHETGLIWREYK